MSDIPLSLPIESAVILASALDRERKIDRVLEALGPIARRDVVLVGAGSHETVRWTAAAARLTSVFAIAFPVLVYNFLVGTWMIRLAQASGAGFRA